MSITRMKRSDPKDRPTYELVVYKSYTPAWLAARAARKARRAADPKVQARAAKAAGK